MVLASSTPSLSDRVTKSHIGDVSGKMEELNL